MIDTHKWDIFISHASEDKDLVARPLKEKLEVAGLKVWFDESTLLIGDNIRGKIEEGFVNSKFGIVILSPNFFEKEWTRRELDGLFRLEEQTGKRILPVWHNVNQADVMKYSPILASKYATNTSKGLDVVIDEILKMFPELKSKYRPEELKERSYKWEKHYEGGIQNTCESSSGIVVDYHKQYISDKLHKYRLLMTFISDVQEKQNSFRAELLFPMEIPLHAPNHSLSIVENKRDKYNLIAIEREIQIYHGQKIEIVAREGGFIEYEMNDHLYYKCNDGLFFYWKLFLDKSEFREGKIPWGKLHCY